MTSLDGSSDRLISTHNAQALKPFAAVQPHSLKMLFSVDRRKAALDFSFTLLGRLPIDVDRLALPEVAEATSRRRRDELWKSTCLEIFVGSASAESYIEMNLAPSGDWNIYQFDSYRQGMREIPEAQPPLKKFARDSAGDRMEWHGTLTGEGSMAELFRAERLILSATAVLHFLNGEYEYWALAHAGAKPDFHLRESFRLPL